MPAVTIRPGDLTPFATVEEATAEAMIADAVATAERVAPCIMEDDFAYPDAAKAVIRGAILRWIDSINSATTTERAGQVSITTEANKPRRTVMFIPNEINQLQDLCRSSSSDAFTFDTAPIGAGMGHSIWCSLGLGGDTCSCGANLTRGEFPLWETP